MMRRLPVCMSTRTRGFVTLCGLSSPRLSGGICNCDRSDCQAMRATTTYGTPVMFRAEYVASINPELCNGCRQCMRLCQFGAIGYSVAQKKAVIDSRRCYGCGICRSNCIRGAITLLDRHAVPAAAERW